MSSELQSSLNPSDHFDEFGNVDSYALGEKMERSANYWHLQGVDCVPCGVHVGYGHCHHCLEIARKVFEDEDYMDGL